jgi:hypothetical protein
MARYSATTINDSAGVQELIPALVWPEVIATSAREEVFMPLMRRMDLTGPGDDFNVGQAGALTFGSYTPAATLAGPTEQAFNTNQRTLTPLLRVCDVIVTISALQSTQMSLQDQIIKEAGLGLAADHDAGAAALYTEAPASAPAHEIVTNAALSYTNAIVAGSALLYTQLAPKPFATVIHPALIGELMIDQQFMEAARRGNTDAQTGVKSGGYWTNILDTEIYVCDQIVLSTNYRNMMFSKQKAMGYGFKRITHPVTGASQELLLDIFWNSGGRAVEFNMTYWADWEGLKGTSTTTNNWMVEIRKA